MDGYWRRGASGLKDLVLGFGRVRFDGFWFLGWWVFEGFEFFWVYAFESDALDEVLWAGEEFEADDFIEG